MNKQINLLGEGWRERERDWLEHPFWLGTGSSCQQEWLFLWKSGQELKLIISIGQK